MVEPPKAQDRARFRERALIALTLFAFGAIVTWHATSYVLGSLRRMGPGYFPLILGIALCVFAVLIFLTPDVGDDATEAGEDAGNLKTRLRAFGFVLGAMIVFATMIRPLGFAPATAMAAFVAGLAEPDNGMLDLGLLSLLVTVFASLVFVVGLGVPVPLLAF